MLSSNARKIPAINVSLDGSLLGCKKKKDNEKTKKNFQKIKYFVNTHRCFQ